MANGLIIQLKKFFTGEQLFPKTKTKAVYDEDGNRLDDMLVNLNSFVHSASKVDGAITSINTDFAEVGTWADGNPDNEDRIGYFVSVTKVGDEVVISKANKTSDVRGVTITSPAFSANAGNYKYGVDGMLLPEYDYVSFIGLSAVYDLGRCEVGGRCMPADDGTAIPSTNSMGYQVIERTDPNMVLILVEPNADVISRIKDDITERIKVEKMTYAEWKAGHDAGTLPDGVLFDTYDEVGEDNTLDIIATKAEVASKANKPIIEVMILEALNWVGTDAPYTYDLGLDSTVDAEILLPNTATADEVDACVNAQITGNGTDNLLRAWGDKPEIDIPIVIRKVVK